MEVKKNIFMGINLGILIAGILIVKNDLENYCKKNVSNINIQRYIAKQNMYK